MLMTPMVPKVMASPIAASSSTEPSEMPYQMFCATSQAAIVWRIDSTPAGAASLTSPAARDAGRGGVLDLAVRRRRRRLQHGQGIAVAALAHQRDRLDLLRRRRVGGEPAGGARLAPRALGA